MDVRSRYLREVLDRRPVGHWWLDEAAGNARNAVAGGSNGVFTNNPTRQAPGLLAGTRAVQLAAGSSQYVQVASYPALSAAALTVVAWFRSSSATRQTIFGRDSGAGARAFFFGIVAAGSLEFVDAGSSHSFAGTRTDLLNGKLHMVAVGYDASSVVFFADGAVDNAPATTPSAPSTTSTEDLYLGTHQTANFYATGVLGPCSFFGRKLTVGDMKRLYQAGLAVFDAAEAPVL